MNRKAISLCMTALLTLASAVRANGEKYNPNRAALELELEVTSDSLDVRNGPGELFTVTGAASRGDVLEVIGMLGKWYVVCLPDGSVGVVSSDSVRVTKLGAGVLTEGAFDDETGAVREDGELSDMFSLVNGVRVENGLPGYMWDERLNKIAQLKAEDMANSDYLSHYSPTYGTPFQMLKELGTSYRSASESIDAGGTVYGAHAKAMSHPMSRANILNTRFNKMGVGIANSEKYGKIIVQMFIME